MTGSILPPNATAGEAALEAAMRADIDISALGTLWNPSTCPADVLPFLAWALAISHWDTNWTEAEKRAAVLAAIPFHQIKGTRAAVEQVLARFNPLLDIVEWWQTRPKGAPHTFQVRADAQLISADFLTSETAEAIVRDVAAAKPLRSHFDFVFALETQAIIYVDGGITTGSMTRSDYTADHDTSRDWSIALQTEDGEPLTDDAGEILEDA